MKLSYQMDTIKAPAALQPMKKVEKFLATMPQSGQFNICPVKDVLHTLTDKWSILIMMSLGRDKTLRFNELKSQIAGISQKMLTVALKNLEASGMVNRKVYPQIPPKVEYSITPVGDEFLQHLVVMLRWACENANTIGRLRKRKKVSPAKHKR